MHLFQIWHGDSLYVSWSNLIIFLTIWDRIYEKSRPQVDPNFSDSDMSARTTFGCQNLTNVKTKHDNNLKLCTNTKN